MAFEISMFEAGHPRCRGAKGFRQAVLMRVAAGRRRLTNQCLPCIELRHPAQRFTASSGHDVNGRTLNIGTTKVLSPVLRNTQHDKSKMRQRSTSRWPLYRFHLDIDGSHKTVRPRYCSFLVKLFYADGISEVSATLTTALRPPTHITRPPGSYHKHAAVTHLQSIYRFLESREHTASRAILPTSHDVASSSDEVPVLCLTWRVAQMGQHCITDAVRPGEPANRDGVQFVVAT